MESKQGTLGRVMEQLRELARRNVKQDGGRTDERGVRETLADDGAVSATARERIGRDEALVRGVLGLVNVDYDALIKMDGASPYSMAVAANPALVEEVLRAENPVLAGLKAALEFKPYAEFQTKYGKEPGEIKEKIKAEVMHDMRGEVEPAVKAASGLPFGGRFGGRVASGKSAPAELKAIFGK